MSIVGVKFVYKWRIDYTEPVYKWRGYLMTTRYKNTFREKLLQKIQGMQKEVLIWSDFKKFGSSRQISRALKDLIDDGQLVRIGRGIYAKATSSKYIDEPIITIGFEKSCIEALKRFNVEWELSQLIKDYNAGKSKQVPAQMEVRLKTRFRRKLTYGNRQFRFEGNINAK